MWKSTDYNFSGYYDSKKIECSVYFCILQHCDRISFTRFQFAGQKNWTRAFKYPPMHAHAPLNLETCAPLMCWKSTHMHQHTKINDCAQFSSQSCKQGRLCFTAFFALFWWPRKAPSLVTLGTKKRLGFYSSVGGMQMVAQGRFRASGSLIGMSFFVSTALTWQIGRLRQSAFLITHTHSAMRNDIGGGEQWGARRCRWHCVDGVRARSIASSSGGISGRIVGPRLFEKALILLGKHNQAGWRWVLRSIYS